MLTKTDIIIIGAGQAGLSLSYFLTKQGKDHLILDKGKTGESWRSSRWDNFHLITPNYMTDLPGFPYKGNNPHGFDSRNNVVKHLENYAKSFKAPIKENHKVRSVQKTGRGFLIKTDKGEFESKNVVLAIGSFHKPFIPQISKKLPKKIFQIHTSEYKNSEMLPVGRVLVVGAGNSGIQIASDLRKSGREVYLSTGRMRIVPRVYRGKDFMEWAKILGILDRTTDEASPEVKNTTPPLLFGNPQTVDLRKLIKQGVELFGRLEKIQDGRLIFAGDLTENLQKAEQALEGFKRAVDQAIIDKKLRAPKAGKLRQTNFEIKPLRTLDIKRVRSVIWATGFKDDYSIIKFPVLGKNGQPMHKRGVSKVKGFYFLGLRWLYKYKSFLLCGIKEDAQYLASQI